ncbi:MAG: hypothetical protein P1U89_01880, partial [Verrucomicrobiales bacterium]|nr:hypothetical protein [Verrucomicrobiales bacterium]
IGNGSGVDAEERPKDVSTVVATPFGLRFIGNGSGVDAEERPKDVSTIVATPFGRPFLIFLSTKFDSEETTTLRLAHGNLIEPSLEVTIVVTSTTEK